MREEANKPLFNAESTPQDDAVHDLRAPGMCSASRAVT